MLELDLEGCVECRQGDICEREQLEPCYNALLSRTLSSTKNTFRLNFLKAVKNCSVTPWWRVQ